MTTPKGLAQNRSRVTANLDVEPQLALSGQGAHRAAHIALCLRHLAENRLVGKLTPNILSSHDLSRPEAKRLRVKLTNLNIPKIDLVEVFIDLLEAENLKSKNLADEYTAFMPAYVAAVVHFPEHKSMRINERPG